MLTFLERLFDDESSYSPGPVEVVHEVEGPALRADDGVLVAVPVRVRGGEADEQLGKRISCTENVAFRMN